MEFFKYGDIEIEYLKKKDKKLGHLIDEIGMIKREVTTDVFTALISSVTSQQISNKAAETVFLRLVNLLGEVTKENIKLKTIEEIQKCGMSMRKATYIKNIANSSIDFCRLYELSDEEIIKTLCTLTGVGVWTAQMLLIFSLERKNVLSFGDLAIRRGIINLYGIKTLTKEQFDKYKKKYSPYGTVASLYLWELSNSLPK